MARKAVGKEHLEAVRELLKKAKTPNELRLAQSVFLPLGLGLSLEQTAVAIGCSVESTCTMQTRFAKMASGNMQAPRSKRLNRAKAESESERKVLDDGLTLPQGGAK